MRQHRSAVIALFLKQQFILFLIFVTVLKPLNSGVAVKITV